MSDSARLLIVRQRPEPHPALDELVKVLHNSFHLDPYTTRQRLLGPGLAQLAQGEAAQLDSMAGVLRRHACVCWVVAAPQPAFSPARLRSLTVSADAIDFFCEGERRVRLERGVAVVGVLADLSGELAGRQVKRMLARNAYLGREQARGLTPEELSQAILKGEPVFDGYLLDEHGAITAAFRALPGRFNPEGLGGRAGLSAVRNLAAIAALVGEYAGEYRRHTDFGLSALPDCTPRPTRDDPSAIQDNFNALTRYGWLVASLGAPSGMGGEGTPGAILAAGLAGMAASTGTVATPAELQEVAAAIDDATAGRPAPAVTPPPPLPPPPERPDRHRSLGRILRPLGLMAGGLLLIMASRGELLASVFRQGLRTGALPGVAAVALCWWGFVCLRLQRFVEDTPTSRIRSLAMGLVEIRGRALRRHALVAPMTQSACVWYRLRKYRCEGNDRWTLTSESDSAHVPFVLDDGSGQVMVNPTGATVRGKSAETGYPGESAMIGALVDGGPSEKWVEEVIFEGTDLYILGYARPTREVGPGLRERTIERLRQLKLDPRMRQRYDADGDGRLDADEWQTARAEAEQLAAAEQLGESRVSATSYVALGKPPGGLPFLIAEGENGAELARRYRWIGVLLLMLGVTFFGVALTLGLEFLRRL